MAKRIQTGLFVILVAIPVSAVVRRVPSEYASIAEAIYACDDGDVVLVASGVHADLEGRVLSINKSITVTSEGGAVTCVLDGRGEGGSVDFRDQQEAVEAVLDGFTITNASPAIICVQKGKAHIRNCIITRNAASGILTGGGEDTYVTVSNCIITNNRCYSKTSSYGGGVMCQGGNVLFRNCVISGNVAAYGGGVACSSAIARFENCIITDNRAFTGKGDQAYLGYAGLVPGQRADLVPGDLVFAHCCIRNDANSIFYDEFFDGQPPSQPSYDFEAFGNIEADPRFARAGYWHTNGTPFDTDDDYWVDGDYHLKSQGGRWDPVAENWVRDEVTSPCIDAGDPTAPIGHEPFPTGGIVNMGAYGGTPEASKAYFGAEPCEGN